MRRILLVEDHGVFREALAHCLDGEPDFEVVAQAGSLAEARNGGISSGFDVALVDFHLPDGEGMDLIRELHTANPDALVLMLTISLDPAAHAAAIGEGAHEVLSKGVRLREIVSAVRRLRDEQSRTLAHSQA